MFVDMAMLVHANGELIDSIELNVCEARDYVEKAVDRLDDGKKAHQQAQKVSLKWNKLLIIIVEMGNDDLLYNFRWYNSVRFRVLGEIPKGISY